MNLENYFSNRNSTQKQPSQKNCKFLWHFNCSHPIEKILLVPKQEPVYLEGLDTETPEEGFLVNTGLSAQSNKSRNMMNNKTKNERLHSSNITNKLNSSQKVSLS